MLKQLLLISAFAGVSSMAFAGDDLRATAISEASKSDKVKTAVDAEADSVHWKFPKKFGLNLGQTAYGYKGKCVENTVSVGIYGDLQANYKNGRKMWNNDLYGEYGMMYSSAYEFDTWRKNLDKLTFTSNYGYQSAKCTALYYSALLDFKTQFYSGYEYGAEKEDTKFVSDIFAPAYLIGSLGFNYIPNKYLSLFVSPVTGRMTICNSDQLVPLYGVDAPDATDPRHVRMEMGAYLRMLNEFDIVKNVHLTSKFDAFLPYSFINENFIDGYKDRYDYVSLAEKAKENGEYLQENWRPVINWDLLLTFAVNKYINASVRSQVQWDPSILYIDADDETKTPHRARTKFSDAIHIGFTYSF